MTVPLTAALHSPLSPLSAPTSSAPLAPKTAPRTRRRRVDPTPALRFIGADRTVPIARRRPALLVGERIVDVADGKKVVIGSGSGADVRVAAPHVSARHCEVLRAGTSFLLRDLTSTNGVWVAGRRQARSRLGVGDAVMLARTPLLVVEAGATPRYDDAICWRGLVARDRLALGTLGALAAAGAAEAPVWLQGDSGTGKEGAAAAVHACSSRASGPFVALNCASLPESLAEAELFGVIRGAFTGADRDRPGAFRAADGGTLFLDEVAELPAGVQAILLRTLECGEVRPVGSSEARRVDVRVVVATWQDLSALAAAGSFRFDLLQRLWVLRVDLPALRERPRDIGPLLDLFLEEQGSGSLWPCRPLLRTLEAARWRGNVRQLRNQVARAAVSGRVDALIPTELEMPRGQLPRRGSGDDQLAVSKVHRALLAAGGNRTKAADSLGVSRSTLYRWMRRTGLG